MNIVRRLLSLDAHHEWNLHQFDVKNTFLHGDLDEEIYMEVLPDFESHSKGKMTSKLKKALYGLKQSPRTWFGRCVKAMIGYIQSQGDHILLFKHSTLWGAKILLVYVDDIVVTGDDLEGREALRKCLVKEFKIKELGKLKYFIGIEVAHFQ